NQRGINGTLAFIQFPMKVDDMGGSGPFMQRVYILRYYGDIIVFFQFRQPQVGGIGLGMETVLPPLVVEVQHQLPVFPPSFRRGHFHHIVSLPQAVTVPEGPDTAFCRYSSPCQYYQVFPPSFHKLFQPDYMLLALIIRKKPE